MENLSQSNPHTSLPKKAYANTTQYDDVFGGPPKYALPVLAPRPEDYAEIFGGFRSSRASSIPVLDVSALLDGSDLAVDVRSSDFDYSDVFGDYSAPDLPFSYHDLFSHLGASYDSSDEAWSPAQSEILSDKSESAACYGRSQSFSNGDYQSFSHIDNVNISYHKTNRATNKAVSNGKMDVAHLHATPGYTRIANETPASQKQDGQKTTLKVRNNLNHSMQFDERVLEEQLEHFRGSSSRPTNSSSVMHVRDGKTLKKFDRSASTPSKPFLTVSDISLRTKPSEVPPPFRAPTVSAVNESNSSTLHQGLEASESDAIDRISCGSSMYSIDVETVANSSNIKAVVGKSQEEIGSAKELLENTARHKLSGVNPLAEYREKVKNRAKMPLENDVEVTEEKTIKSLDNTAGHKLSGINPLAEDREKVKELTRVHPNSTEIEKCYIVGEKSSDMKNGNGSRSFRGLQRREGSFEWREATGFLEVVDTNISSELDNHKMVKNVGRNEDRQHGNELTDVFGDLGNFDNFKAMEKGPLGNESRKHEKVAKEISGSNHQHMESFEETKGSSRQKANPQAVDACEKVNETCVDKKKQKVADPLDIIKDEPSISEVEAKQILMETSQRTIMEKRPGCVHVMEENERRHKGDFMRDDFEQVIRKAIDQEDIEKRVIGRSKQDKKMKQREVTREREECEKRPEAVLNSKQIFNVQKETFKQDHDVMRMRKGNDHEEKDKNLKTSSQNENEKLKKMACGREATDGSIRESSKPLEAKNKLKASSKLEVLEEQESQQREKNSKVVDACGGDEKKLGFNNPAEKQDDKASIVFVKVEELGKRPRETFELEDPQYPSGLDRKQGHLNGKAKNDEEFESDCERTDLNLDPETAAEGVTVKAFVGSFTGENGEACRVTEIAEEHDKNFLEEVAIAEAPPCEQSECSETQLMENIRESDVRRFDSFGWRPNGLLPEENPIKLENTTKFHCRSAMEPNNCTDKTASKQIKRANEIDPGIENVKVMNQDELGEESAAGPRSSICKDINGEKFTPQERIRDWTGKGKNTEEIVSNRKDKLREEREIDIERQKKIEEEREREREREKDGMFVDRVIHNAREKSNTEGQKRAASERDTAEARRRVMAEARERLEKASAGDRERSAAEKASMDGRHRAHQVAVERATGVEGESPQRCKARLERFQRTADRAAKALAEKNMRDLLAQREQEERHRLAEALDAEVKRWSSGKQGNLRALLSTLQYILGPDSGWRPTPLTEVITSAAVKKAYRKATLCVHPDKLQQRGASIQQKYICEKVFDLLKEAWSKFSSEEL